ncbi:MAG TPA: hypothetical protein DEF12_09815 [Rhodobacteraceae bacterium]|jgi:hypothetical protein|nr:hypothetical protein [Paracoccaceae bacterium]
MRPHTSKGIALLIAACLTASQSAADVTAQEVWSDWKDYLASFGYKVEATESPSGATLSISNLTMSMALPDGEGDFRIAMDRLDFTEKGDGTVAIEMPASMPFSLMMKGANGNDLAVDMTYSHTGLVMLVSGTPGEMAYTYSADSLAVALASLQSNGVPVPVRAAQLTLTDIAGQAQLRDASDKRHSAQTFDAANASWLVAFDELEKGQPVKMEGALTGLSFMGTAALPQGLDLANMTAAMGAGFAVDSTIAYATGKQTISMSDDSGPLTVSSSSQGGDLRVAVNETMLAYSGSGRQAKVEAAGGMLPIPVSLAMENAGFNLRFPLAKSDEPGDFAFGFDLTNFTMSDMIWAMIDPTGQLPRDPATLAVDLTGKAKITADMSNPNSMSSSESPGELHALSLNTLSLRLAGADLSGKGAFTFDNSDLTTFDGMPRPTGALDLRLIGGNALLDKLVAMGLLPEDQAMGARMMMGLFGRMEGEDTLTSKIEVTPEGAVLANGQRLR